MFGDRKPFPFLQTEFNETQAQLSPDGRWVAYNSDESGKSEVYVRPFPAGDGKWQISTNGGVQARWRRDGKELFYLARDSSKLMAVEVKAEKTFVASVPKALFETRMNAPNFFYLYAASANGQRFLLPSPVQETASAPLNVVVNWTAALHR